MARETLRDIELDIRANYATVYYSEDCKTISGEAPEVMSVEPYRLFERVKNCKRWAWMVTVDGSLDGKYENMAYSLLFATKGEAIEFVNEEIKGLVLEGEMMGRDGYTEDELRQAMADHCEWLTPRHARYAYLGSTMDYEILSVTIPIIRKRRRSENEGREHGRTEAVVR